jgi:hypothetical protein
MTTKDEVVREMREHAGEVFFSTLNDWADRLQAEDQAVTGERASVELFECRGNRYWDYDAGSGGPQAMSDLPLGTYIHTGETK